jgi:hypothetical protein
VSLVNDGRVDHLLTGDGQLERMRDAVLSAIFLGIGVVPAESLVPDPSPRKARRAVTAQLEHQ